MAPNSSRQPRHWANWGRMSAPVSQTKRALGIGAAQRPHRVEGEARAQHQLGRIDADARMAADDLARAGDAGRQRLHAVVGLERVLRRDQPPHLVEPEPLQRLEADMAMALVRGIERAAQKADAARRVPRHARHRMESRRSRHPSSRAEPPAGRRSRGTLLRQARPRRLREGPSAARFALRSGRRKSLMGERCPCRARRSCRS